MTALETARLILRPWTLQDAGMADHIYGDAETMRYFASGRTFTPVEIAESLEHIVQGYVEKGYGNRAVVERSTGEIVGHCGFHESGVPRVRFEADWVIERSRWGRGYATEAARAMLRDFFACGFEELHGVAHRENAASLAVMRKIGMRFEREIVAHGAASELWVVRREFYLEKETPRA